MLGGETSTPVGKRRVIAYRPADASLKLNRDANPGAQKLIAAVEEISNASAVRRVRIGALLALARKLRRPAAHTDTSTRAGAMFATVGVQIARCPCAFIFAGALLSLLSLGVLRMQLKDLIRDGYTPEDAPSRWETSIMREFWNTSADPIMTILLVQARDGDSMLRPAHLSATARLSRYLMEEFRPFADRPNVTYASLCDPFCSVNLPLETFADTLNDEIALLQSNSSLSESTSLTYPVAQISGYSVYLERMFFGVQLRNASAGDAFPTLEQAVTNMESVKVITLLFRGDRSSPDREAALAAWELAVYDYLYTTAVEPLLDVEAIGTEILDREMLEDGRIAIPYFAGGFLATVAFVFAIVIGRAVAASDFDIGKIWCAVATVVSPTLAIALTYGCLSLLGLHVNSFLLILPYLVFGIGVDDGFLIMHAWFEARQIAIDPKARAVAAAADARRLADVLTEVGPSITVTTLTNVISFAVGAFSPTPEIRLFCFGTTLSLSLVFLLQFLFLCPVLELTKCYETRILDSSGAATVLDDRMDDYLSPTVTKGAKPELIVPVEPHPAKSNQSASSAAPLSRLERAFDGYCKLLSSRRFALALAVVMVGYCTLAVAGTLRIQTRLDASKILPDGSRIQRTNLILDQCVWNDYLPVTVFVNTEFDLTNRSQVSDFDAMMNEFERLPKCRGAASTMNWLRDYRQFLSAKPPEKFDLFDLLSDFILSEEKDSRDRREIDDNGTVTAGRKQSVDTIATTQKDGVDTVIANEKKMASHTILEQARDRAEDVNDEHIVATNDQVDGLDTVNTTINDTVSNAVLIAKEVAKEEEGSGKSYEDQKQLNTCRLWEFLDSPYRRHWSGFLRLDEDPGSQEGSRNQCPKIKRFMVTVAYHDTVTWTDRIALMLQWREIAHRHGAMLNATVWEQNAMFVDQMLSLKERTIQAGTLTLCCMVIVCALFVSNPFSVVVASTVITSICVGVFGFLSFMSFDLDPITMAALLMSIGLSVDYTAHVTYHFQQSSRVETTASGVRRRVALTGRDEKLRHALRAVGWPLVQAAVSTALCVLPLLFIRKYAASVFFVTICMVTALGLAHGLIVLPCVLRHLPAACSSYNFYAAYCTRRARRSYAITGAQLTPPRKKKATVRRVFNLNF